MHSSVALERSLLTATFLMLTSPNGLRYALHPKCCWSTKKSSLNFGAPAWPKIFWGDYLPVPILPSTPSITILIWYRLTPDDNKFADTYLAANADYLVSNDHSLLALHRLSFPPVRVVTLQAFSALVNDLIVR